ncbi:sigma-54-dependent transcriptional regulator [Curvivirga aplysinae]|uniref:sigma-54-dependent transcriptional regulator n=1 Tax=Curvivirga aplysinae TaxID=2529852 RepID=UPI0012BCDB7D|nr:sigma-54 dependent transcriptional regulator [Curvivirga aplysinae]MTI09913.1 sigma-54-dependent Fis family transcriptional regulator [Curvivirga aplysinae]
MAEEKYKVAVVDDDREMRESLEHFLGKAGFDVEAFPTARLALDGLSATLPDVLVTDMRMPGMSGFELLDEIKKRNVDLPVVLISAHGDVPMAVEAMQKGAYTFLEKPFDPARLARVLQHGAEAHRLSIENSNLRQKVSQLSGLDHVLLGDSGLMHELKDDIRNVADTEATIMVLGETGTGKEVVARSIHDLSPRVSGPFVAVNCAAIPENLFEASMFGHVEGAFTGATSASKGYFASANGGTLFLDELGACPLDQQAKLLRALENREVMPVGSTKAEKIDIRVVSATNENLEGAVQEGRFREDLFYRLNTLILELPPLRTIKEDIVLIFTHFLTEYAATYGTMVPTLTADDVATLQGHDWPGNVRELRQVAERRVLANRRGKGTVAEALSYSSAQPDEPETLRDAMNAFERQLIVKAMENHSGDMETVASSLSIGRRTLNEKLVKYDINRTDYL